MLFNSEIVLEKIVFYPNDSGSVAAVFPVGDVSIDEICRKDVPSGKPFSIVEKSKLPNLWGELFDALEIDFANSGEVKINMNKAKVLVHQERRALRERELEPLDLLIMKQIPGVDVAEVEAKRQQIRDKYSVMQTKIDCATTPEELKVIVLGG